MLRNFEKHTFIFFNIVLPQLNNFAFQLFVSKLEKENLIYNNDLKYYVLSTYLTHFASVGQLIASKCPSPLLGELRSLLGGLRSLLGGLRSLLGGQSSMLDGLSPMLYYFLL